MSVCLSFHPYRPWVAVALRIAVIIFESESWINIYKIIIIITIVVIYNLILGYALLLAVNT